MPGAQWVFHSESAAPIKVILQSPPQSQRDGPSGEDVGGHKNHASRNDLRQQNMKNVMVEQQQEQDSMSITRPGTLELQVDHHNYPQYLPGYSQPTFSTLGGPASPRYHLGPPRTRSSPSSSRPGRPIQQQMINLPEISSSSFTSASYFNPPNSPRPMFQTKNPQVPIKLLARSNMIRQEILREGKPAGSTNGCSDIDEVHDSVGLSTSDSSTVTSSWNSEDYILPFFDTTFEPQFKPLSDVDSETALAGLALPVNEWHKLPITFDDTSPGITNQPSHEFFQATHTDLAQNKYGGSLLTEEEMGSWTQFSSPISSSAARHFSQGSRAAVAIERRKAKKTVEKAERLPCRNCGKYFFDLKRHLQYGHGENFLLDASHIQEVFSHLEGAHSSPGTESQRQNLIFNEHAFPCNPEHASWDRRPRSWSSVKLRAAQLNLDMMTDKQYKECAAKLNALVDVRPIDLEVADCIIRGFHRSIQMRTDDDTLLEMTAEKALMAQKRKEADISEKQATNATAHPPIKEIAHSADTEGVPALVREEAYPTSAKSRSQSLVAPTSECSNAMQLSLDLPHVSPTRNNTLSSFTEDDTDWGEDEIAGSLQDLHFTDFSAFSREGLFSQDQMNETLMRPVFSPMKEELIDRIMKEFWAIFDQESGTILGNPSPGTGSMGADENLNDNKQTASEGGEDSTQNTGSNSFSTTTNNSQKSTWSVLGRHSREGEDDDQDNGDGRSPKKPKAFLPSSQTQDDNAKFACPYRKRDPRKYCVQHWRICALTPQDTVARVKGHLYRYHSIFPCHRCQELFKDQGAVRLHLKTPEGCALRDIEHTDGVTPEIVEKLRSKKRVQRDQTEAERWRDIYKLLFPNEMTPSPYFETVQEDTALSPDSRELADYEEYCRRELPKDFRAALEEIVHNESQPMEERIRNRLLDIVRDCQDRVFSRYRSSAGRATATPSINPTSLDSPMISMRETRNDMSLTANGTAELSFGRITPPFFHPPSPQSHLRSRLEVSDLQNNVSKAPDGKDPSDSGYSSNTSGLQSQNLSSFHDTIDSASLSTSQSHVASSESFSANAEATWNLDDGLFGMNPGNDVMNGDDTSTFDSSWADFNAPSAEGNAWNPYMSNSEVEDPFSSDQPL